MVINNCMPTPEEMMKQPDEKTKEEFMKNNFPNEDQMDKDIEQMKKVIEMQKLLPPKPPSIIDMLGGPSITSQLGPILSGVNKMLSTMPTKNKLEGNLNGGNFSIEIVDEKTRAIAVDILNNLIFDKQQIKNKKKD